MIQFCVFFMDSSTQKMAGNTHSQLTSFLLKENQNLLQIQEKIYVEGTVNN